MKTATLFKSAASSAGIGAATILEVGLFAVAVTVTGFLPADTPAAVDVEVAPADGSEGSDGWSEWIGGHDWHCESWACESASPEDSVQIRPDVERQGD